MRQIVLVGAGAGGAAALLFAAILSGSPLAVPLLLLAPLPILIVTLGWSHLAGLVATGTGAIFLALVGADFLLVFVAGIGLPAWWLGYLALLARPAPPPGGPEWYPTGRLVLWAAGISAFLIALISLGGDFASLQSDLRAVLASRLDEMVGYKIENADDAARLVDYLLLLVPAATAATLTLVTLANLWLAGCVVQVSGRLNRPWPRVPDLRLPAFSPALLGAAVAASFLPDVAGACASAFAASLMVAHVLAGLALVHAATLGLAGRGVILGCVYAAMLVFRTPVRWPFLVLGLIGIADALLNLRVLIARARGAKATTPPPTQVPPDA